MLLLRWKNTAASIPDAMSRAIIIPAIIPPSVAVMRYVKIHQNKSEKFDKHDAKLVSNRGVLNAPLCLPRPLTCGLEVGCPVGCPVGMPEGALISAETR